MALALVPTYVSAVLISISLSFLSFCSIRLYLASVSSVLCFPIVAHFYVPLVSDDKPIAVTESKSRHLSASGRRQIANSRNVPALSESRL